MKDILYKLKDFLFPIKGSELRKFLPMALIMFFILFNYTVVRNLKDSLVINAEGSGAEIISFLKMWGVMPSAILFMVFYSKMTQWMNREKIFYVFTLFFTSFFGAFAFFIYPHIAFFHPEVAAVISLKEQYPMLQWFFVMWGNWSFVLFYILLIKLISSFFIAKK